MCELSAWNDEIFEDIAFESTSDVHKILDARSEKRFQCIDQEPRKGLRSGQIPNSLNIPYQRCLAEIELKKMKS